MTITEVLRQKFTQEKEKEQENHVQWKKSMSRIRTYPNKASKKILQKTANDNEEAFFL